MSAEAAKKDNVQPIKPKKGKMLFILVGVVVLAAAGAGAWFALKPKPAPVAKVEAPKPPIYYKFDPAFVVNFGGEGSARYLQVAVQAMTRDPVVAEELKTNEPAVRNDLILLFSAQDSATLLSADGKEKLRVATLEAIRKELTTEGSKGSEVEAVYFTSFVIQ